MGLAGGTLAGRTGGRLGLIQSPRVEAVPDLTVPPKAVEALPDLRAPLQAVEAVPDLPVMIEALPDQSRPTGPTEQEKAYWVPAKVMNILIVTCNPTRV